MSPKSIAGTFLLLLIGTNGWARPVDRDWLKQQLLEDNRHILRHNPSQAAKKFEAMAASPYAYFRGSNARFAELLASQDRTPRLELTVNGDAHLLNYGPLRIRGKLRWGPNDQDEACVAPLSWDLMRDLTSCELAARELGLAPKRQAKVGRAYLGGYLDELKRIGRGEQPAEPPNFVKQTLAAAAARDRRGWLEGLLDLSTGEFRPAEKIKPLPGRAGDFQPALQSYLRSLPPRIGRVLSRYQLGAVAEKHGAGLGSIGMRRYLLALRHPEGRSPIVIQLKEEIGSSTARYARAELQPPSCAGERVARARVQELRGRERLDGWASFAGKSYWVKELGPHQSSLKLDRLGAKDLLQLARANGAARARAHSGALATEAPGATSQRIMQTMKGRRFSKEVLRDAHCFAAKVTAQYRALRGLQKAGALLP